MPQSHAFRPALLTAGPFVLLAAAALGAVGCKLLKGMPDDDGRSVLDNTLVFQSTDVSDGDKHNHDDMPVIMAGGAAGFRLGQHVQLPADATAGGPHFGHLFITIAKAFGVNLTTFGEKGTAPLAGLT